MIAWTTGCKGKYALMDLDNHNPITQTFPDAMHMVKVVVEHLFMLIVGKGFRKLDKLKLNSIDLV